MKYISLCCNIVLLFYLIIYTCRSKKSKKKINKIYKSNTDIDEIVL